MHRSIADRYSLFLPVDIITVEYFERSEKKLKKDHILQDRFLSPNKFVLQILQFF